MAEGDPKPLTEWRVCNSAGGWDQIFARSVNADAETGAVTFYGPGGSTVAFYWQPAAVVLKSPPQ